MLTAMRAAELIEQNCSIARPATLLGDPWTLVILRQAFSRVRRFEDFQRQLGISRSLLADRLNRLVETGILRREPYKDEVRTRHEYRLTQKGLDLYPALMALREWGDRYMADEGAPLHITHRDCGGEAHVHLTCDRCGEEIGARDTEVAPGPGLRAAAS
jgi:DNA-binding HxlR family transcriptional regulator